MKTNKMILAAGLSATVAFSSACGGGQKTGSGLGGGKDVPPPPPVVKNDAGGGTGGGDKGAPKIEVSQDAKKDYASAMANFDNNDKGAWSESACRGSADQFAAVVREHKDLVAAQFMVGLSYHRCNLLKEAEAAYQTASHMQGDPTKIAMALSNLGEIYYRAGKIDG